MFTSRPPPVHGSIRTNASSPPYRKGKSAASTAPPPNDAAIRTDLDVVNADPKPFRWTKSGDDILAAVKRFCLKTLDIASAQAKIATTSESGP
jgi:hypothetical protein